MLEPGRFIVGNAGILVSRVIYTKESGGKHFVIQDAAMNDLIRPTLYDSFHRIWPVEPPAEAARPRRRTTRPTSRARVKHDVVGPVCESGDFLAKDRRLPPLQRGDLLATFSAGAYGMAMSSNYNSRPRAAEVLVDGRDASADPPPRDLSRTWCGRKWKSERRLRLRVRWRAVTAPRQRTRSRKRRLNGLGVHFMFTRIAGLLAAALLLAVLVPASAQVNREDYRQFLKPPDTVEEYFKAIHFELEFGQFKLAAFYLKNLLGKNPTQDDLVKLEQKEGMSQFLKLRLIRWADDPKDNAEVMKDVEELIERTTAAVKKHYGDPDRINKLIRLVQSSPHERLYAVKELRRSGASAMVPLLNALAAAGDGKDVTAILQVLPILPRETVPAQLAALDIANPIIQGGLIDALRRREDFHSLARRPETDPTPQLFYLVEVPGVDETVQAKARATLAYLLEMHPDHLPKARTELTRAAERFYKKQMPFADPKNVRVFSWSGKEMVDVTLPGSLAEEYYGLRLSKQALEIDPYYEPAQDDVPEPGGGERRGAGRPGSTGRQSHATAPRAAGHHQPGHHHLDAGAGPG